MVDSVRCFLGGKKKLRGHQVPDVQEPLEVRGHGEVVHGHEDGVEDNAGGDA